MKNASLPLYSALSPNWQLLGELELRIDTGADSSIGEWLMEILKPLHLSKDFTGKIVKSAEEAIVRAMQSETVMKQQHTHLLIYIPADRPANGGTWGFFRIEKVGTEAENENPRDHAIEFYLYLEGR